MQPIAGGHDSFGVSRLPRLIHELSPDVIVLLNDPWNIPAYLDSVTKYFNGSDIVVPPIFGWLAVDAKNQHAKPLNLLAHVAVWTQFAAGELALGGYTGECSIIPLGVDTSIFYPRDKTESRLALSTGCDTDLSSAFVVGCVGRNQPRKRLDLTIQYFAEWIKQCGIDDAYLYLHVGPTGDMGFDIVSLVRYYGVQGKVLVASPEVGKGLDESLMPVVYSSLDVLLNTSQGEGWGLTVLEAMACGTPCIVPDWSGLGDWARGVAYLVPCTSTAISAPLNSLAYTIGGIPDKQMMIDALSLAYNATHVQSETGIVLAKRLSWQSTASKFQSMLENVLQDLNG